MIDKLFGSKTRIKLLHLFLNNPGKSFYVREITRLVDEQINSVRRELSNMLSVGIITSNDSDNKLYYEVNKNYEHYAPMRAIFSDQVGSRDTRDTEYHQSSDDWRPLIMGLPGARLVIASGGLVQNSGSKVDLLIVGSVPHAKLSKVMGEVEKLEGREINYSTIAYEEFYYRLSIHDKFITEILNSEHAVILDTDNVLKG